MAGNGRSRALPWRTAWVTGASSGIGEALALRLAAGGTRTTVSARSVDRLSEIAAGHDLIEAHPLDVTDDAATMAAARAIWESAGGLDLVVLNAGVWPPMSARGFSAAKSRDAMAVNFLAMTSALEVLLPAMCERGSGHVALTASVAGYRGLPRAGGYAPSKAAVIALAECLRPDAARFGVTVSVINPGFVETPMTAVNDFPMPFILPVEDAADRIIRGLERKSFEVAFPWQMVGLLKTLRVLPYPLYMWIARTFLSPRRKP